MKITITVDTAINGATVKFDKKKIVYKFDQGELEGLKDLIRDIKEFIGPSSGKYDKERISISVVHGRGYTCKEKKCELCKKERY